MLRRDFLKYISAVTAMALVPTTSFAAANYEGPLWVFVQAGGGWDPTSLCDPKGYAQVDDGEGGLEREDNPMNKCFRTTEIRQNSKGMRYPSFRAENGLSQANADNANLIYQEFFEQNANELLIINGIDTQTNGHSAGQRYMMSGRLAEGYPAISALIAGINLPTSPLAFITAGGYDETDGVVAGTRLSNINAIKELAFVNSYDPEKEKDTTEYPYQNESVFNRIQQARADRLNRINSKQKLDSIKDLIAQYGLAHSGSNELSKLVEYLPKDINTHPDRQNRVFSQGRFAMAGYKAGLTTSVNIITGGYDTHGNHDASHVPRLATLLKGVNLLKLEAQTQGIADRVVFVIGSEFGRTPGYNGGNGKDHWSVSSMMFMGAGIRGGRVIGSSSPRHEALSVDATSLAKSDNGIKITYAHVNKALRKLSGIATDPLVVQYYPLDNSLDDLNLFS